MSDLATAKAVYATLLGVPPQTDGPYYVGFEARRHSVAKDVREQVPKDVPEKVYCVCTGDATGQILSTRRDT